MEYTKVNYVVKKDEYKGINMSLYECDEELVTLYSTPYMRNSVTHEQSVTDNIEALTNMGYIYKGMRFE